MSVLNGSLYDNVSSLLSVCFSPQASLVQYSPLIFLLVTFPPCQLHAHPPLSTLLTPFYIGPQCFLCLLLVLFRIFPSHSILLRRRRVLATHHLYNVFFLSLSVSRSLRVYRVPSSCRTLRRRCCFGVVPRLHAASSLLPESFSHRVSE